MSQGVYTICLFKRAIAPSECSRCNQSKKPHTFVRMLKDVNSILSFSDCLANATKPDSHHLLIWVL